MSEILVCEREVWGRTHRVRLTAEDRRCHTYVVGKTGSGKSTLLRNIFLQEAELGRGVGIIDPHGDLAQELLDGIPRRRADDVVLFDPGDADRPCAMNVLRGGQPPDLVASSVVAAFKNIWSASWGPRTEYILYAAVAALAECENASLMGIPRLLNEDAYRAWVVRQVKDPVVRSYWSKEFAGYERRFRNEVVSPILNKVGQFLMSPLLRNILGQVRCSIDFREVLDRGQIFIANLSKAHLGEERCALLGSLLVTQFEMAALSRARIPEERRIPFGLMIDEFHNFVTDSFATILSESRKYGLHLTLCHQHTGQVRPETRQAIFGNAGAVFAFRTGYRDAEILAEELGAFSAEQISGLGTFELAARATIGGAAAEPFLGRSLPPMGEQHGAGRRIAARSRERFTSSRSEVEAKIERWLGSDL